MGYQRKNNLKNQEAQTASIHVQIETQDKEEESVSNDDYYQAHIARVTATPWSGHLLQYTAIFSNAPSGNTAIQALQDTETNERDNRL